jgi:hypothetical protein
VSTASSCRSSRVSCSHPPLHVSEEAERNAAKRIHGAFPNRQTGAFERTATFFPGFQNLKAPAFVQIHDSSCSLSRPEGGPGGTHFLRKWPGETS